MKAKDVMTSDVETVLYDATLHDVVRVLMRRNISAVPVIGDDQTVVGIVSEGDLIRRQEIGTETHPSWWLQLLLSPEETASRYTKTHGVRVSDIMSSPAITAEENTPIGEIAKIFEEHGIKRVPILRDGRLQGIVSRADLLRALAAGKGTADTQPSADDSALRDEIWKAIKGEAGVRSDYVSVIVSDGIAHLWGAVRSDEEREAARVAAEGVVGDGRVDNHLGILPPMVYSAIQGE